MTANGDEPGDGYPNRNVLWAETLVEELAAGGLEAVVVSPGSRSTPLTVAVADRDDLSAFSVLDERAAAFFALGRARRTGEPTALVCTSGTAAANYHPAILEASQARVPLLALTADRPPELRDSGANQTVDQEKLYGDAVRWYRDLPEPEATPRKLKRLRTDAARALAETRGTPAGPVHLNCPFRKPLEPTDVPGDVPEGWDEGDDRASAGRFEDGERRPFVRTEAGRPTLSAARLDALADVVADAETGVVVAGPADPVDVAREDYAPAVAGLGATVGFPVLADVLSTVRYGPHVADAPVVGGYDGYVDGLLDAVDPDVALRFGASPTSKPLRKALAERDVQQVLVDPAGEWRDAEFATDTLVAADPVHVARELAERLEGAVSERESGERSATERALALDEAFSDGVASARVDVSVGAFEGEVLADVVAGAPDPSTVVVSNSMPVRDADRFAAASEADVTVVANRGASGIDGVTSTALGAGSATSDELVYVTGDLAYYHDMNGLLSLSRCGVDATIVVVNNDGGGIFHELPIAEFEPPFTEQFQTPHGMDFAATGDLYDLAFERVAPDAFADAYERVLGTAGTAVLEVGFDAAASHDARDAATERARETVRAEVDDFDAQ
ncbi:2-succinyl-5-enolpyruvyl-6-hydroxy-3-cyclohexene-1-carboxylic-acid synthase [Halorubellus sp. JP-L1]|uniref:2-succinyl-5-enolpyruvyl-6-hydroxy-3- cyclohexene-1-carboxylic-acid synthase n=1 Tax=Halorubellus sp. JP-L1 TaxID=2715753 RepID=UPI001408DF07|nr:2-succinyl-5-enolpyruvyl-6-hydroxy-3-cyclohexene-1-carboxylic-acid synthase [Halorubellus sp. JP-L1]NHN40450.1 2-succinyl-5-enolpyruvyl-6-hydroxy-3-cyclohexene-1-carboxylic-acid synthase [Halorubellus sp. JP-L1]